MIKLLQRLGSSLPRERPVPAWSVRKSSHDTTVSPQMSLRQCSASHEGCDRDREGCLSSLLLLNNYIESNEALGNSPRKRRCHLHSATSNATLCRALAMVSRSTSKHAGRMAGQGKVGTAKLTSHMRSLPSTSTFRLEELPDSPLLQ